MIEFAFFNTEPARRFMRQAESMGLQPELHQSEDCLEVRLPEDLDDAVSDALENLYDQLLDLEQSLVDADDDTGGNSAAGVVVRLSDGRSVYADVAPELLGKLLQAVTADELGQLVDAIVSAVEAPDERPLCKR